MDRTVVSKKWTSSIIQCMDMFSKVITGPYQTASGFQLATAFILSAISAGGSIYLFLTLELFSTYPVELLGCYAYYMDINITNRLLSVFITTIVSMLTFHIGLLITQKIRCIREFKIPRMFIGEFAGTLCVRIGWCLLPLLTILISGNLKPNRDGSFWIQATVILCALAFATSWRGRKDPETIERSDVFLLTLGLSFFVTPALLVGIKPIAVMLFGQTARGILLSIREDCVWIIPILVLIYGLFAPNRKKVLCFALFPVQTALLCFYFTLLPCHFLVNGAIVTFFPAKLPFVVIVLPLLLAGIWDCARRCILRRTSSCFSPFTALAILVFLCFGDNPIPSYGKNLYEIGSRLPQFWASVMGWATLFKDMYITYGLWDYLQFALGFLFTGTFTAAATIYGTHLALLFLLCVGVLTTSLLLPAIGSFFLMFWIGIDVHTFSIAFACTLFLPRLIRRPSLWIVIWGILSAFIPFMKFPQGVVCVVASLPFFGFQAVLLFRRNRKQFWYVFTFLLVLAWLLLIGPLSSYFWGIVRIFLETLKVNAPWAANDWSVSDVSLYMVILGNSIIVTPTVALIACTIIFQRGDKRLRSPIAFFLFSYILIYALCCITYGFSRTDYSAYHRQYDVLLSTLPLILAVLYTYSPTRIVCCFCVAVFLCFLPFHQPYIASAREAIRHVRSVPHIGKDELYDAAEIGLPWLGYGRFPEEHLTEEWKLKQSLDLFLSPEETFLDLTVHGLHYFSSQRRLVTEYPVYYVYPGDIAQFRAIKKLRQHKVRVSLLQLGFFDSSPAPLRTHYLFRYALLNGLPLAITKKQTLLLPPQYFVRAGLTPPGLSTTLSLLDKQFSMRNLNMLPLVWGRGFRQFSKDLESIQTLKCGPAIQDDDGWLYEFQLNAPVRGLEAGLLVLDCDTPIGEEYGMTVSWGKDANNVLILKATRGTIIVPLDASHRWLLDPSIRSIDIKIQALSNVRNLSLQWTNIQEPVTSIIDQAQLKPLTMIVPLPSDVRKQPLLAHIIVTCPKGANKAQLFYRRSDQSYAEKRSKTIAVHPGHNELFVYIPGDMVNDEIRFDPGGVPGRYIIHTFEIKRCASNMIDLPFRISHAQLMQRRKVKELELEEIKHISQ